MDRCKCGGVRHWHAIAPRGCDDCECREFVVDFFATENARTHFRAYVIDEDGPHRDVTVFAGPNPGACVGTLRMLPNEAHDLVAALEFARQAQAEIGSVTL